MTLSPPQPARSDPLPVARPGPSDFGAAFWFTYAANLSMTAAFSGLYRYSDFVFSLGGGEERLAWIIGLGMIGSLLVRVLQGLGIDTYGARVVWLASAALYVCGCLAHLALESVHTSDVFLCRLMLQTGVAGFFGASISFIAGRSSIEHMAEMIGTLGTSGFIGIILGTLMSDLSSSGNTDWMFLVSGALGSLAFVFGWLATAREARPPKRRRPPLVWLLKRYQPGSVMLMGVATGLGLGLPTVFLQPYMLELGIPGVAKFFFPYMVVAFITRLSIRRLPALIGIRPMILLGLAAMVLGVGSFLAVRNSWDLLWPALFIGIAHACMFPAVVAGGSGAFPARYRGLGTTLMLAMFDLGGLIGPPIFGRTLSLAARYELPRYTTAFLVSAFLLACSGAVYAWFSGRKSSRRTITRNVPPPRTANGTCKLDAANIKIAR